MRTVTAFRKPSCRVPGRGPVHGLQAGLRTARSRAAYIVQRPVTECYTVAVPYTVCKPCYEQHVCQVPVTCTRQVVDYRTECRVGTHVEMVEIDEVRQGLRRRMAGSREYCPGPVVTQCCKSPGFWIGRPVYLLPESTAQASTQAAGPVPGHLDLQEGLVSRRRSTRRSSAACRCASSTRTRFKSRAAGPSATRS